MGGPMGGGPGEGTQGEAQGCLGGAQKEGTLAELKNRQFAKELLSKPTEKKKGNTNQEEKKCSVGRTVGR